MTEAETKQTLREINRHYADAIPASTRSAMQGSLQSREADFKKQKAEQRAKDAVARKDKEFHRSLKPVRRRVEMGDRDVKQGLNAGSSMSKARNRFRTASTWYNRALRGCDKLKKKYGNDASYASDINYLHEQATKGLIDTLLHEASILTSRGSFNRALGNVNRILAMDSGNTRALAMRGRIETAANEGWY